MEIKDGTICSLGDKLYTLSKSSIFWREVNGGIPTVDLENLLFYSYEDNIYEYDFFVFDENNNAVQIDCYNPETGEFLTRNSREFYTCSVCKYMDYKILCKFLNDNPKYHVNDFNKPPK